MEQKLKNYKTFQRSIAFWDVKSIFFAVEIDLQSGQPQGNWTLGTFTIIIVK